MFQNAKKGDEVYSVTNGWGTVRNVSIGFVHVNFPHRNHSISYQLDGRLTYKHINPTLFWDEIPIPESAYKPPRRKVKKYYGFYKDPLDKVWRTSRLYSSKDTLLLKIQSMEYIGPFVIELEE